MMSFRTHLFVAGLFFACLGSARAGHRLPGDSADQPFTLAFDENGNAQIDLRDGTGPHALQGQLMRDPTNPGGKRVLTYLLPVPVQMGDVGIYEGRGHRNLSDVLRFTDAEGDLSGYGGDRLIFYSGRDGDHGLADRRGLPDRDDLDIDHKVREHRNPDGSETFRYLAGHDADESLFLGTSEPATRRRAPDPAPEPTSLALAGTGLAFLAARRWRRRGTAGQS